MRQWKGHGTGNQDLGSNPHFATKFPRDLWREAMSSGKRTAWESDLSQILVLPLTSCITSSN